MAPTQLQSLLNTAVAHHRAGRLMEAENLYRQARVAAPRNFDLLHLSGMLALQQGRLPEAVDGLSRARKLNPRSHACAFRLGHALMAVGRGMEAEQHFRSAVQLMPDYAEGWHALAYWLKTRDRLDEAIECHERGVNLMPNHAPGWYNYGLTLNLAGRVEEALQCHDRALAADPQYSLAHYGRAQALHRNDRVREAVEEYGKFIAAQPKHHEARSNRLFALQFLDGFTREEVFAEHVAYGRALGSFPAPVFRNRPDPARRLRVAILSPDLRTHSCAYFLESLLAHLDRAHFEIVLYHDHFREDVMSARLRAHAALWRNFVGQSATAVEAAIRGDAPDILIDLAGHTGMTSRLPLLAGRLAPVQVTYLGYPDTTGVPAMDYRFTDAVVDPVGEADRFATEKLVRFAPTAWSYAPPADAPEPGAPPSAGGGPVTFGCYNNAGKLTDTMLAVWAQVLLAVPESRLVLKGNSFSEDARRAGFAARFERLGIASTRVDLLERTPDTASHLALYRRMDIALDTFPYHGTTTTCEALWMGVPVVSLAGNRHVSRVGASLLSAAGHPEWIARDPQEYVRIAVELARDRARLSTWRTEMREKLRETPLLDHPGQAARFGAALRGCWEAWCGHAAVAA